MDDVSPFRQLRLISTLLCITSILGCALIMPANAAPIQVPDLTQCELASDTSVLPGPVMMLHPNCCLPVMKAVDFHFNAYSAETHVRRPAHKASDDYIAKYTKAYELMKALPDDDPRSFTVQAKIHCAFCNFAYKQVGANGVPLQVHFSWLFLPWHRWYLYFHERILASLLGDPSFSLLFWNWDDQRDGGNVMPAMFVRNGTSLYDVKRSPAHLPPALVELSPSENGYNNSEKINENLNVMYQGMVTANSAELFTGYAYRTGTNNSNSTVLLAPLGGSMENGMHNAMHFWTGDISLPLIQDMGTFTTAAKDPIFFTHHSNIDRLWEVWRFHLPGGPRADHSDSDFLDAEFYFYDENAQLVKVKVRDALDNKKLGVSYPSVAADELWINYAPPAVTKGSAVAEAEASGVGLVRAAPENGTIEIQEGRLVALVERPAGGKPSNTMEVLTIQGLKVTRDSFVAVLVFVNMPNATNSTATSSAEYVGTFNIIPNASQHKNLTTDVKFEIGDNLQRIGIQNDALVVIALAIMGQETVTIQGLKITYDNSSS